MSNYKPKNRDAGDSRKKEERKKIDKVVTGKVVTKKKSEIRKLTDIFVSDDVHSVKSYVIMDVLIPTIKNAIYDIIKNGAEMTLFGSESGRKNNRPSSKISYNRMYDDRNDNRNRVANSSSTAREYNDIVLDNKGEAEEVLYCMDELIDTYGMASIADLYDLVGISTINYMDNKYGWTNLAGADAIRVRDGYLLKFPKAIAL